jgi:N4-gp56 family major capsid protein|tara:strand:+ start:2354 stop:3304 length:951 start_codon:yes stop_codon:yes gene_type:complete
MAQFQWQFDAPSGVFKSHAMSQRLYMAALENSVFMDFVQPVDGYGRKKGDTVTLTRIAAISEPSSSNLTEGERIPEDSYSISTTSITVVEIGRSVPFTSFAEDLTFFDLENGIQRRLRDQMGLTLDSKAAAAFKTAQVKYIPTGLAAGTFDTDGTASTNASANWNVFHIEEVRDYLFDTLQTPPWQGEDYVAVFRTLGLRGIKRDPSWEEWHKYTDPQAKFNNEIGRIENIRHIETNHANALAKKGSTSALGEGVVFGQDAVAMAEVLTPEIRAQTNVGHDFGRSNAAAWYGILEFGIIWDTANAGQARIVHVTSS